MQADVEFYDNSMTLKHTERIEPVHPIVCCL